MTSGAWASTAPYREEPKDRWLRIRWAAEHFKIDYTTLLNWARTGTVTSRHAAAGHWLVSERSLRQHLFGSPDARS